MNEIEMGNITPTEARKRVKNDPIHFNSPYGSRPGEPNGYEIHKGFLYHYRPRYQTSDGPIGTVKEYWIIE